MERTNVSFLLTSCIACLSFVELKISYIRVLRQSPIWSDPDLLSFSFKCLVPAIPYKAIFPLCTSCFSRKSTSIDWWGVWIKTVGRKIIKNGRKCWDSSCYFSQAAFLAYKYIGSIIAAMSIPDRLLTMSYSQSSNVAKLLFYFIRCCLCLKDGGCCGTLYYRKAEQRAWPVERWGRGPAKVDF